MVSTNRNWMDDCILDIAERYGKNPTDIDITLNGKSMLFNEPDGMIPREARKRQLIDAFTEPLLTDNEIPVRPNNIDDFVNSMQSVMAAGDTPYVAIAGTRYAGKTTVAKNFAYRAKTIGNQCMKLIAGRETLRILPSVSEPVRTAEADAFDAWLRAYQFEDCKGVMLYTDDLHVAEALLNKPGLKIPLLIEMHADFTFGSINVPSNGHYPVLAICADNNITENENVMVNVINDRRERYIERFGWVPSENIIRIMTRAMSLNSTAEDFSFEDTLAVIDAMCGEYAASHKPGRGPNKTAAFKYLEQNYGLTMQDYNEIPPMLPMRSAQTPQDAVNQIMEMVQKAVNGQQPDKQPQHEQQKKDGSMLTFDSKQQLVDKLRARVIGQNEAIDKVIKPLIRAKAGLNDQKRPIANVLFAGPSGVGKTELAKAIADAAFGNEENMLRIDCGELSDKWAVSRLLGSMPGYVGSDQGGQLSNFVMKHPNSVLLFDEIEKADPAIYDAILLQLLDAGRITSGKQETVDCTGCMVIMTSNLGADKMADDGMVSHGFTSIDVTDIDTRLSNEVEQAMKEKFRPELINRFDEIIVFNPLTVNDLARIFDIKWEPFAERLKEQRAIVHIDDDVRMWFAENSRKDKFGARNILRAMNSELLDPLAEKRLEHSLSANVNVSIMDNKIAFKFE